MNEQNYSVSEDVTEEVGEILDKVDRLGPEQKEQAMLTLEMHYGPIPHPEILKKYEELDKGAAKLIIENGVQESVHRREMEKSYFKKSERDKKRGQYLGFLIGTIVISGGVWLINGGHAITGTLLSGTSLLGLVGSFTSNESDNQTKRTSEEKTKEDE
ncbi:DUF2335 domain-containing protein [Enterococcus faecalis]|uniref:DUF2335 domain-containing protein n=1 Tax=Enterococcus faecalis TaxID=1351 RepID=UPI002594A74C|nr:DUF2335 domain-containing protein [Enterococcus faecalis]MDM3978219.1 DUF2335 domain-containing protein [Enterococcus faecalis]